MGFLALLFSPSGRIGRLGYWGVGFLSFFMMIVLWFGLVFVFGGTGFESPDSLSAGSAVLGLALVVVLLAMSISGFMVQIKRWHDRDKSAIWLVMNFVPIIGPIWVLIECGFLPGTPGANTYGTRGALFDPSTFDEDPEPAPVRSVRSVPRVERTEYTPPAPRVATPRPMQGGSGPGKPVFGRRV
ncbi:DUF805 domain-containing protein [Methylobrevis pamukkalensis]|uniref:Inner membrane protein YhaI n=1 Tax=Methylobrevis pamukkalensis TaxID=1439726 RepID=A0A1E3H219_9HYPH|nr:DUF805 domain-containing protein [Methylobrevis pamukkalensis]ODN70344.1 hypothetical protein A6302_02322 [Methylobrevis pamukkalensis]